MKKGKKGSKFAGGNYKAADVNLDSAKPSLKNKSCVHHDDIEEPPLARKHGKKRVLKPEIILDNDSDPDPPPPPKRKKVITKEPFEEYHDRMPPETVNADISKPYVFSKWFNGLKMRLLSLLTFNSQIFIIERAERKCHTITNRQANRQIYFPQSPQWSSTRCPRAHKSHGRTPSTN